MKLLLPLIFICLSGTSIAQKVALIPFASGVPNPIDLKHCGDDRLFTVDRTGRIYVINADATVRTTPFLDIRTKISSTNSEEGLLGLAFSPDYSNSGKFYVNYTSNAGGQLHTVVEEYRVSGDPNIANAASALTILTQNQPFANHNGGNMMFGKDGYLYINLGDGGSGGDPQNNAQNRSTFLGKVLRIDVSNASAETPYAIPSSNPFFGSADPTIKKEIWAYGLRNPWRSSFDKLTGDMWIADVGQGAVEEIDFEPADGSGGRNYGWSIMEGNQCYKPATGCSTSGLTLPLYTYTHSTGQSITGGYVSRSAQSKSLFGMYLFSDFVGKWVDGLVQQEGALRGGVIRLLQPANAPGNPISFGEDRYGELYMIMNGNNTIYKLTDTSYLRQPVAYFAAAKQSDAHYILSALQGRSLTYQWLLDGNIIAGAVNPDFTATQNGTYTLIVTNTIGNSDTSEAFVLGPLPVRLGKLTATEKNGSVWLEWNTLSEDNIRGYYVEKQLSSTSLFTEIGFVPSAQGTSNAEQRYSFIDAGENDVGLITYRIRAVDLDGTSSYSNIAAVHRNARPLIRLYPNPAEGVLQIDLPTQSRPAILTIFDQQGRKLKTQLLNGQTNRVDLRTLKGIYPVQLKGLDGKTLLHRLVLLK